MRTIEMRPEDLRAAAGVIPEDAAFFVLDLLRYRERADHGDRTDTASFSGREAYHERYAPGSGPGGGRWHPGLPGRRRARVVGPADERWGEMAIVEYPELRGLPARNREPGIRGRSGSH